MVTSHMKYFAQWIQCIIEACKKSWEIVYINSTLGNIQEDENKETSPCKFPYLKWPAVCSKKKNGGHNFGHNSRFEPVLLPGLTTGISSFISWLTYAWYLPSVLFPSRMFWIFLMGLRTFKFPRSTPVYSKLILNTYRYISSYILSGCSLGILFLVSYRIYLLLALKLGKYLIYLEDVVASWRTLKLTKIFSKVLTRPLSS